MLPRVTDLLPELRRDPWLPRIVVALGAITTGTLGVLFLAMPEEMARIVELEPGTPLAVGDIRTVYGGLELGLALLGLGWLFRPGGLRSAVWLHIAIWGGLAGGRTLSIVLSSDPANAGTGLLAIELVGFCLGIAAWWSLRRRRG
jgi:hypothetical protein